MALAITFPAAAQGVGPGRRKAPARKPAAVAQGEGSGESILRQNVPKGWVWVTQAIDLSQQFGGDSSIMTLDGEPLSSMRRLRITLGLVLDDEGHIATRLIDVTPNRPPKEISVRALGSRPVAAKFVGMDTVSGLCVLKVEGAGLEAGHFSIPKPMPEAISINLYGFHPNKPLNLGPSVTAGSPRVIMFKGRIARARNDFRYNLSNPVYTLLSPVLTAVQDCSIILDGGNSIFGLAIYNAGIDGNHLVFPVSRILGITRQVIETHKSITHGWLGATGRDEYGKMITPTLRGGTSERGVRITAVAPDSPAETAGVRPSDLLLNVNDRRVETYAQLATIIRQIPADNEITLRVRRGSEYKLLKAKLIPSPAVEPEQQLIAFAARLESMEQELRMMPQTDPYRNKLESKVDMMRHFVGVVTGPAPPEIRLRVFYGFEVQLVTGQLLNYFAAPNGLLVSTVIEGGRAYKSGLRAGDVISGVGETQITDFPSLMAALDRGAGDQIQISIFRNRELRKIAYHH